MTVAETKSAKGFWLPVVVLLLLVAVTFFGEPLAGEREGSDDRAVALAESLGAEPVASLPFEPSEDAERWLFVLQGGLGIGLLMFAMRQLGKTSTMPGVRNENRSAEG
jgi:ABC-type cobalt transport system substrate-binding protein